VTLAPAPSRLRDPAFVPDLGPNAEYMLRFRYLDDGETPVALFRRVALNLASAEATFDPSADVEAWADRFFRLMTDWDFLPNAPTLLGAGRPLQQLHACFVLPVEDSIESIFSALRMAAIVHSNGGGTGFSFGALRGRGEPIATGGVSTGAVSFMRLFDAETEVVKHGGTGWGANMGVLPARHPDIEEFVCAKAPDGGLRNFNLSVAVDDAWMRSARSGTDLAASRLLDLIASRAWASGDPGLLFLDRIERDNPVPSLGPLQATNPCGEAPLLPFEACCLGGLNVLRFVAGSDVDWPRLRETAALALRLMDNVIEMSRYPLPEIAEATRRTRKIGIGVMGFADLLIALGIPYGSPRSEDLARKLMREIRDATRAASIELGAQRGSFPAFDDSLPAREGVATLRNATTTSNAPNSTIGAIAGCSPGIEPLFALSSTRHLASGDTLTEVNAAFERAAREGGFLTDDLLAHVREHGTVQGCDDVPAAVRELFVTAHDLPFECHVALQAAFQDSTDLGISKTINLPRDATPGAVRDAYVLAWERGCKGVTVFRDGCLEQQFIATGASAPPASRSSDPADGVSGSKRPSEGRFEPLSSADGDCEVCT
jgi:ribonucleoside-diphosphate reductase alpha chain